MKILNIHGLFLDVCVCMFLFYFLFKELYVFFLCARVNNELYSFILPLLSLIANEKGCDINMFCCKIEKKKNSSVLCLFFLGQPFQHF